MNTASTLKTLIVGFLVLTITTSANSQSNIVFEDDFNRDYVSSQWTVKGKSVEIINGSLEMRTDETDNGGNCFSKSFPINTAEPIIIYRKVYLAYANNQVNHQFKIAFGSTNSFNIDDASVQNAVISYSNYQHFDRFGIFIGKTWASDTSEKLAGKISSENVEVPWNRYFDEVFTIVPTTGKITETIQGKVVATFYIPPLTSDKKYARLFMSSYGWFTGHKHAVDYIKVVQNNSSISNQAVSNGTETYSEPHFSNEEANARYTDAVNSFSNGEYAKTIIQLFGIKEITGKTTKDVQLMLIRSIVGISQWKYLKEEIETYKKCQPDVHSEEYNEVMRYYNRMDAEIEREKMAYNDIVNYFSYDKYNAFMRKYPHSDYKDDIYWSKAKHINTSQAYIDYVSESPSGKHMLEALKLYSVDDENSYNKLLKEINSYGYSTWQKCKTLEKHLAENVDCIHQDEIRDLLIYTKEEGYKNDPTNYAMYCPNGKYIEQIKTNLETKMYEDVKWELSVKGRGNWEWERMLYSAMRYRCMFPNGTHIDKAEKAYNKCKSSGYDPIRNYWFSVSDKGYISTLPYKISQSNDWTKGKMILTENWSTNDYSGEIYHFKQGDVVGYIEGCDVRYLDSERIKWLLIRDNENAIHFTFEYEENDLNPTVFTYKPKKK